MAAKKRRTRTTKRVAGRRGRAAGPRPGIVKKYVVGASVTRTLVTREGGRVVETPFSRDFTQEGTSLQKQVTHALDFMKKHKPGAIGDRIVLLLDLGVRRDHLLDIRAVRDGSGGLRWNVDHSYIEGIRATPVGRVATGVFRQRMDEARRAATERRDYADNLDEMKTIPMTGMSLHEGAAHGRRRARSAKR